ncbi:MAG: GNAT family N-acetyltransferase [Tetrasphaera sp.]
MVALNVFDHRPVLDTDFDDRAAAWHENLREQAGVSVDQQKARSVDDLWDAAERVIGWAWWWWSPWLPSRQPDDKDGPPPPEELILPDGTKAWIRPILPTDRDLHVANFERLSDDSKYKRFLGRVPHLTEDLLQRLVDEVDGVNHVGYFLFLEDEDSALPTAIGRIVRDPQNPAVADAAVTVNDSLQGHGIGTALLRLLVQRRPHGVKELETLVLAGNKASLGMLRHIGPTREVELGSGTILVRLNVEDTTAPPPEAPPAKHIEPWRLALRRRDHICRWLYERTP